MDADIEGRSSTREILMNRLANAVRRHPVATLLLALVIVLVVLPVVLIPMLSPLP